ncbi:hypothetical protein CYMTET_22652 [Cymbomonas tetramitiformis]|uniref:Uncharacterized protein n=1 Tax=Cymbomonas tetramitiformis TaxID=36881 RepID=A0AAE0FZG6_9CHLO|nr:hypothetical protein CYMTET_22652 [Cymbomonas tetramitiformis]
MSAQNVSSFHAQHFPAGHSPTDFAKWQQIPGDAEPYRVPYSVYFEPYIVAARTRLPRYDERFRGYGMNKISHLHSVAVAGNSFLVLPSHFVIADQHEKSVSWQAVFGAKSTAHSERITILFDHFTCQLEGSTESPEQAIAATVQSAHHQRVMTAEQANALQRLLEEEKLRETLQRETEEASDHLEVVDTAAAAMPGVQQEEPGCESFSNDAMGTMEATAAPGIMRCKLSAEPVQLGSLPCGSSTSAQ